VVQADDWNYFIFELAITVLTEPRPVREFAPGSRSPCLVAGHTLSEILGHVNHVSAANDAESCDVVIAVEQILPVMQRMHEAPVRLGEAQGKADVFRFRTKL
jgi:hypothetical protein